MFKQAISVVGVLQSPAPTSALTMQVDNAFASYLRALLGSSDWTYINARVGNAIETIKITAIDPILPVITVVRGLDGQTLTLAPGQELKFALIAQAVQDMLTAAALAPAITITGAGNVTVTQPTANHFVVSAPQYNIQSTDGSLNVATSNDGNTPPQQITNNITANTSAIGCCVTSSY